MQKHIMNKRPGTQSAGYILVVTVILLAALLVMSLSFVERTKDSLQIAGYNRGAAESVLIAESAMNLLYGRIIYNADLDTDGINDIEERINFNRPEQPPFPYLYFVSATNNIEQASPSILQRIANGEARGENGSVASHIVNPGSARLKVTDLYSGNARPIVFEFDAQNRMVVSNKSWSELEGKNTKAAVAWVEMVKNDNLDGAFQFYAQAVGKAGNSKSYVQRLILKTDTVLGSDVPTLGEASTR